ncbi:transporter substrate-binding domain-containing protein [Cocleimonas sp. KMM 6892]|uniref:substrate-binding periplasmic protein n=1 Tax=unclassified Cocleimonas TaxID=2639732 RepID=UPI002DB77C3E|nr:MULTISPECIES: transporter substrate-binding domain-containing protein [unclassified Cocleimonas]MEB8432939.1 transporter substrate-binding domain-containing protein [Cocleimonas sp. KMM 6892]MEC4716080.1 transporter substrate-binding domain-containing protein [Cocleimonas sp. KMM 6895]MEC4745541.1 transporter substrate-binding domain-containing protein [Cocleimonas sp. KMM 6896]
MLSTSLQAETLKLGIVNLHPHMFLDENHEPKGAAIDYFKIVAKRMGLTDYVFEEYPLSRLVQRLEEASLDAALFLAKNPKRELIFQYPKLPYSEIKSGIVVNSSSALNQVSSEADLTGFKIGTIQNSFVSPMLTRNAVDLEPLPGVESPGKNLKKLAFNRLDAVYLPCYISLTSEITKLGMEDKFKVLNLPEPPIQIFTVFSPFVDSDFVEKYESAVYESDIELYKELVENYL